MHQEKSGVYQPVAQIMQDNINTYFFQTNLFRRN